MFKWIKQHLRVKRFWGDSENAVRIQIHVAIITYSHVAIIEHGLQLGRPVFEVMRSLEVPCWSRAACANSSSRGKMTRRMTGSWKLFFLFNIF